MHEESRVAASMVLKGALETLSLANFRCSRSDILLRYHHWAGAWPDHPDQDH